MMVKMANVYAVVGILMVCKQYDAEVLRFANYYTDHMVLQMAPAKANIWGYTATVGENVTVYLNSTQVATVQSGPRPEAKSGGMWSALLPAQTAGTSYTVKIESGDERTMLEDVLFGDVWVCSGQSNMYFTVNSLENTSDVIAAAMKSPNIRFMKVGLRNSTTPVDEPAQVFPWQPAANNALTKSFSAVCLLYAMELEPHLQRPIGLVETSWGGTPVEAWSSPDALSGCQNSRMKRGPHEDSVLWNAMVNPLLPMTIFGAIWYQGESNAGKAALYACQFPAMIRDWRQKFHKSQGQTSETFPFGFVQLAPNANKTLHVGFPDLRWSQTAGYGYVPNAIMNNVFMAVAMDLPDYDSPYGSIHPRDKFDVAQRLALSGRAVAYGESSLAFQGPFPTAYTVSGHKMVIEYDNGNSIIDVRTSDGFEVCCGRNSSHTCLYNRWTAAPITEHDQTTVTINTSGCHGSTHVVAAVRYAWEMSPCDFKMCAIYDQSTDLPAPSFTKHAPFS